MIEKYNDNNIKLYNGDVLNKDNFPENFFNLTVCSPPYNIDMNYENYDDKQKYEAYLEFIRKSLENIYYWTDVSGRLCLNIPISKSKNGRQYVSNDITNLALRSGWKYQTTIIWVKNNIARQTAWGSWKSASAPYVIAQAEFILVLYKDIWKRQNGSKINDIERDEFISWTNGIWDFKPQTKKIGHPAPFPMELPKRCIKMYSFIDDKILDPFAGSGTTLIQASKLNRQAYGLEIDKSYCDLITKRINNLLSLD